MRALLVCLAVSGCASSTPYVTLRPVGAMNELAWNADGPSVVITVRNPTARVFTGYLKCYDDPELPLKIAPGGEWSAIGQVLNKDVHAEPCKVVEDTYVVSR